MDDHNLAEEFKGLRKIYRKKVALHRQKRRDELRRASEVIGDFKRRVMKVCKSFAWSIGKCCRVSESPGDPRDPLISFRIRKRWAVNSWREPWITVYLKAYADYSGEVSITGGLHDGGSAGYFLEGEPLYSRRISLKEFSEERLAEELKNCFLAIAARIENHHRL